MGHLRTNQDLAAPLINSATLDRTSPNQYRHERGTLLAKWGSFVEWLMMAVAGAFTGVCASRIHPRVNPGTLLSIVAGALGGLVGAPILGGSFSSLLYDTVAAGATAGAALGGIFAVATAGIVKHVLRRRSA
jgi:uncharacterized membrane protein YeaQ/YmgE (transglycosylase-associated protein family)